MLSRRSIKQEESDIGRRGCSASCRGERQIAFASVAAVSVMTPDMRVVFIELGQDVHIWVGSLSDAVNFGIQLWRIREGFLRNRSPIPQQATRETTPRRSSTTISSRENGSGELVAPKYLKSEILSGSDAKTFHGSRREGLLCLEMVIGRDQSSPP